MPEARAGLGSGRLLVAGTRLTVSPEAQTVPFNTPTIVETHLQGYDAGAGALPADLRVLGDLTGPEIDGVMVLETVPNEPFRIPRLSLKGQYQLDNIRLVQGSDLLAYAEPRSSGVLVTQVLVTHVTSRPLSLDEIRAYGVVLADDNYRAFNFTFGFAVDGKTFDYNLPVIYEPQGGGALRVLEDSSQMGPGGSTGTTAQRFAPPQLAPFNLTLAPRDAGGGPSGGCEDPEGDCYKDTPVSLPGVILFPTDVTLLHQFFSVVLVAKNDAPAGDPLRIRDLTAKVVLPSALRMAETEPPTPLGVPVPIRVPGPDGKLGTSDDITFLIAQAEGQAEVVVESLRQGTHFVEFQLDGILDGLPGNEIRHVVGTARGAVVVRDPTLGVTITHPDVVRADEEYSLLLTVANTSNAPINLITLSIPASGVSGAEIVGDNQKSIPTLASGESEVVEFRVKSLRTGKVVASSVRNGSEIDPHFEFTVGVGENGIPLSPTSLILPRTTDALPQILVRRALAMLGLGYSLATLPNGPQSGDLPRIDLEEFNGKVYWLTQAGRHVSMGEDAFDSLAVLAAEWNGARDQDWEWDKLRRTTQKGGLWSDALAQTFTAEATRTTPLAAFERLAATTGFLGKLQGALATGSHATLEVTSRTSGKGVRGAGTDPIRVRTLPFADLYELGDAEMVSLAVPEEGGYQAWLRDADGGNDALHLLVPATGTGSGLRMVHWSNVTLSSHGVATVAFQAADDSFTLHVDADGDGVFESDLPGSVDTIAPRPFTALAAVQNDIDPSGHMVEILFTQDVDIATLLPLDPNRFTIPGKVSNGGLVPVEKDVASFFEVRAENPFKGLRDTRIVRVIFDNPISPYVQNRISIRDLKSVSGQQVVNTTLAVRTTVTDEGTMVRGTVYGADGQPVPFARVELQEVDFYYFALDNPCRRHVTAAVQADASGHFLFDYVRKTSCTDIFTLDGQDPASGKHGSSSGRVRFVGDTVQLDIVMLGRGTVHGKVQYEDGSIPSTLDVVGYSPVFFEGRKARVKADGSYEVGDLPVGAVTLGASDRQGSFVYQTVEIPIAGAVVERNLVIIRRSVTQATGDIRGVVYATDGTTPIYKAYLALYVNGELAGVQRSGLDGRFDFGTVPAGRAEIEAFDGETGLAGAQVTFDVQRDQVNQVTILLRNDRGTVVGHVYRQTLSGTTPLAGIVVWVSGTPFNTVTDASGAYRLEGVFAGNRQVLAADLVHNVQTSAAVSITGSNNTVTRDLYFVESVGSGLAGEVIGFNGNPVPGATVHLSTGGDQWFGEATTDAAGRFVFPNLGVGSYAVHAFKGADGGVQAATIRFQGETPFVRVQFKRGTIRGHVEVREASGQLVGVRSLVTYRTTVVRGGLVDMDWEAHTLETNNDGTFEIPNVLTGRYVVTVSNAFHGEKTVHGELIYAGDVAEHDFLFETNGTIRGVVLDWDGTTPVAGAKVYLRHPSFSTYDLTTDAEGKFKFELVPPGGTFPIDVQLDSGAIFRQGRIWVTFNKFGQEMDVEVALPRQGIVNGVVENAAGQPVPNAVVTLQESSYPNRTLIQNADGEGNFSFTNIFAGTVSVSAKAPSLGGLGGKTSVTLTGEGEEAWALVTLEATGEITGHVLSPVDHQPVPTVQVSLYHGNGLFDTVTADPAGAFRFRLLPLGSYDLRVFDPRSGRHGKSDGIAVQAEAQVAETDVVLEARGEVDGHLYEPNATAGIPAATIRLESRSLSPFVTYSSTDVSGYFEFLGIPEGSVTLTTKEPEGRRRASGTGEITAEGQRITVDLYLEASGRVVGTVRQPVGLPDGAFPNANTLIYQDGQVVGATLANPFTFAGIIAGHPFELRAFEVGGDHRAYARGRLESQGQEVTADLRMVPIGATTIVVRNSFDVPVAGADVTVTNNGFYGEKRFAGTTDASGRAAFAGLGEGTVSAYATHPVTGLRGSGNGQIAQEGQALEVQVRLEDSGQIHGRVVLSDGVTPAVDALVVVTRGGRVLQALVAADGTFSFASVPLGAYTLDVQEHLGPGKIERTGTVAANGQVIDAGTLVLDDADPFVTSLQPVAGTRDLALSTTVIIRFSERLDRSHFNGGWINFQSLSGRGVGYTAAWADNDATLVLTPNAPLDSFTGYQVIVSDAWDPAGRRLSDRVKTVFYTVDVVPPTVVDVLPRDGQRQVPVDAQIHITFSEPVTAASLSGSSFQLTDATTGQGVTTTFLQLFGDRDVLLTPASALATDHQLRLTVQGVKDKSGNTMTQAVTTTFWTPDTIAPAITGFTPAAGTTFTAGSPVAVTVTATDASGLGAATLHVGSWAFTASAPPYAWTVPAPVVAAAGDVTLSVEVRDIYGNVGTGQRTIRVEPRVNAHPPQAQPACGAEGDAVVPGVDAEFGLAADDDESVESIALFVNGQEVARKAPIDTPHAAASFLWRPPADAAVGTSYAIRLEARDFAGNVTARQFNVAVLAGTTLKGTRTLQPSQLQGQRLILSEGTFTLRDPAGVAQLLVTRNARLLVAEAAGGGGVHTMQMNGALRVQCGGVVTPATAGPLHLTATDTVTIGPGGRLDVAGTGYAGGAAYNTPGGAPAGVTPARGDAGGSHGGQGTVPTPPGLGDVFDSVYAPHQGGGGGANSANYYNAHGTAGGGSLDVAAPALVLDGEIRARGIDNDDLGAAPGAGGAVRLDVATLSGAGLVDASGGFDRSCWYRHDVGTSGGGRVAIYATTLSGFDPAAQVKVQAGGSYQCDWTPLAYGSPGTLYLQKPADTYGRLWIDAGAEANGAARRGAPTPLPVLGEGAVGALTVQGADALLAGAAPFKDQWLGVWVVLVNAAGADLNAYKAVELTADGRLRLAGAGTATGAVRYRGEYRFDRVDLLHGAGLTLSDPLWGGDVAVEGDARLPAQLRAQNLTLRTGAVVTPAQGSGIALTVPGTLHIEAGARLDVSGSGYPGGTPNSRNGGAPAGVTASTGDSGGSHGGVGTTWNAAAPGAVYDSVYRPFLAGGGGAESVLYYNGAGQPGGGVVELDAGTLVLDGEIRARGVDNDDLGRAAGAGGTVRITAQTLSGTGSIDASGGLGRSCIYTREAGSGGGGRVALLAATLSGFDPAAQVKVWGGARTNCESVPFNYAAPGTLLLAQSGATYGTLVVDNGQETGADRTPPATRLPALGSGAVTAFAVDAASSADAWVSRQGGFSAPWLGARIRLLGPAGQDLGLFLVTALDAAGRAHVAGAGTLTPANAGNIASYRGEYHFDTVDLRHGAGVIADDPVQGDEVDFAGNAKASGDIVASAVRVKAGAVVQPAAGGTLRFVVSGTMTIEAGGRLDVSGLGYAGGVYGAGSGGAPAGVTPSTGDSGGSHGGVGTTWGAPAPGAVYDSVYQPHQAGGGGAESSLYYNAPGQPGGGVVDLQVGTLVLDGEIRARGLDNDTLGRAGGAGGTVLVKAAALSGAGSIDTSGGFARSCDYRATSGSGGGGRVALRLGTLTGFDPAAQVKAWGGGRYDCAHTALEYAAPGTIFSKKTGDTYGSLLVDGGQEADGSPRAGHPTQLPALGSGAVTAFAVDPTAGTDAWISRQNGFGDVWTGAWVVLLDAADHELGAYEVTALGTDGRVRLAGAGALTGVAKYRGEYRFDGVDVRHGAGVTATDPVSGNELVFQGPSEVSGDIVALNVRVKSGAVVKPAAGVGAIRFVVTGTLTVEAGGRIDVTGKGYPGGSYAVRPGGAPAGVTPATSDAGGSHGGLGTVLTPPGQGAVYDSVYAPFLGGGGGARSGAYYNADGTAGGGVVELNAGILVLDGEIRARGVDNDDTGDASGAGGTVHVVAGTMSGAGLIDASGGFNRSCGYQHDVGTGGGGRVALEVGTLTGFVPESQVKVLAGGRMDCARNPVDYASPGTIFVKQASQVYGSLIVDSGQETGGAERRGAPTLLPTLGEATVASLTAQGGDALLAGAVVFPSQWRGAWVVLANAAGAELGTFRAAQITADGKLLLAAAGPVATAGGATRYRGQYLFDQVELLHGAGLSATDRLWSSDVAVSGAARLPARTEADTVTLHAGAVATPAQGSGISLAVSGTVTVEAGARFDLSGAGYPGGTYTVRPGGVPAGVTAATSDAGGSHGGLGTVLTPPGQGAVYDSVYAPFLAGGGGARSGNYYNADGTAGGGIFDLTAGTLVLAGDIRARGGDNDNAGRASGAGGTVRVVAAALSGAGTIDASGGFNRSCGYQNDVGTGGGGRVALEVGAITGFVPATQVKVQGGGRMDCNRVPVDYASPGTLFVKQTGQTWGTLILDNGFETNGALRRAAATPLPPLGTAAVVSLTAQGADALLAGAAAFPAQWRGVWVTLRGAAGQDLGTFRVTALAADGRLLLAGAGTVTGASSYQGQYLFDDVQFLHDSAITVADRLWSSALTLDGNVRLPARLEAQSLTLHSGAVVTPAQGSAISLAVPGTLTVQSGARFDVSGSGYPGGTYNVRTGGAPAPVTGSTGDSGGSHGGPGVKWGNPAPGETYDSVYFPALGGGGGARSSAYYNADGQPGGGVLDLTVGTLVLDGELRARGLDNDDLGRAAGAGGTVHVVAAAFSGAGTIDASGGLGRSCYYQREAGAGGGGRVALDVGTFTGFDPVARVNVRGGGRFDCTNVTQEWAAPGTLFTKTTGQTYGSLRVDQGGTGGKTVPVTLLPAIGKGTIGSVATEPTDATALWIVPADANARFGVGVVGLWVRIDGVDYRVTAEGTDRRRVLLAGAANAAGGGVTAGKSYVAYYKFDALTVAGGAKVELRDGDVLGSVNVDSTSTLTRYDLTPPAISVTSPAAGAIFAAGDPVHVTAAITDPSGVTSVTFHLGDQSQTFTAPPYDWTVPAPVVETEGDMAIHVEATDGNANIGSLDRMIHLRPRAPGVPPVVTVTCPTAGAILAPGTGIDINATATHDDGVERVELLLGSDPAVLATDFSAPFTLHFTAPASAHDGDVLQVHVRARSFGGVYGEAVYPVKVVEGNVISADTTLTAADTTLESHSVVVTGGTFTITGTHNFRDLVVLDGAKVTHAETTATQENRLDIGVQRDLYISCAGAIDTTARGYLGAASLTQHAYGYGNTTTEGALAPAGGSHGGRGGRYDGTSPAYGNLFDPRDLGAGGGYDNGTKGRDGGGVIRVTALGNVIVDGSVLANGESGVGGGGAGGSIRLNGAALSGAGRIQANGSTGTGTNPGGGSGGRVALYAATVDAGLLSRTTAAGALTASTDASRWGAAGTLFVRRDAQPFGDLILDNAGTASTQYTDLLAVRSGVIDSVSTNSFTDSHADFRHDLSGIMVAFNGDLAHLFGITGHAHHGQTLTLQVPAPPLSATIHAGDTYRGVYVFDNVTVRGGARGLSVDKVAPTNPATVAAGAQWTESYTPVVQLTSPTAGAVLHSGDSVTTTATVQDVLGVQNVVLAFGAQSSTLTASPYTWSTSVPVVSQSTTVAVSATATDLSGNKVAATFNVQVDPALDPNPPVVTLTGCSAEGDVVQAGTAFAIPFTASDDKKVLTYSLVVNGQTVQTVTADVPAVTATLTWTPAASTPAGTAFALRVEARDYAGNVGAATRNVVTPSTTPRTGTQNLTAASLNGTDVFLGAGTFTVQEPLSVTSLTLLNGAKLLGVAGQTAKLTVAGTVRVQCGTAIDLTALGYAGTTAANGSGGAPAGVNPSHFDAGGSHGGPGAVWSYGPAGDVFDSVYAPHQGGGGGSLIKSYGGNRSGYGGGALDLTAAELVLNGTILSKGEARPNRDSDTPGAGGSILLHAGTVRGNGLIDASGADYTSYYTGAGSAGGGRVALYVDTFQGFDPVVQVKAWGGTTFNSNNTPNRYAGPGTVFVKTTGQTWGRLIVDSGEETSGADRVGPVTPLPVLGTGAVTAAQTQGSDLLVSAASAFKDPWLAAWMELKDAAGTSLGLFPVASIDGQGRVLLTGAGAVTTAATWNGVYRFDRIDLRNGAGLAATDTVRATTVQSDGNARLPNLTVDDLTLKAGGTATVAQGGSIKMNVTGTLTVETGAVLDVTALGYAGTTAANGAGSAPAGVTPSVVDGGGSHGGPAAVWTAGPAGDIFDSVYLPHLGGGGGSLVKSYAGNRSGNGGGVIDLTVGSLVLNGELRARGEERPNRDSDTPGAGGSVVVRASTMSGSGKIDASGGSYTVYYYGGGSGGGGRVALYVDAFQGFDPAAQVKAWGGTVYNSNNTVNRYAAPGTVFIRIAGQTWGQLVVDSGEETNGTDRVGPVTPLPVLGTGAVTAAQAQGSDLLVSAASAFKDPWLAAWMELKDASGTSLGLFPVASIDGQGRALLTGAGAITTAATWNGVYRFDRIDLRNGGGLAATDTVRATTVQSDGNARLPKDMTVDNLTLKAGGTATVAVGGTIKMNVTGTLTVETGAVLDVTALGYAGTTTANGAGSAPAGVTPSVVDGGGSHGGPAAVWTAGPAGDVFDSAYMPHLGGGGGSLVKSYAGNRSGNGGGVIDLTVGNLVLNGELRAKGEERPNRDSDTPGGGGSVVVRASTMSGSGKIDASGGSYTVYYYGGGSGGGGRVALLVDAFQGFDPVAQVKAWGGTVYNSNSTVNRYAAPGTVFIKSVGQTWGQLVVDSGKETNGTDRVGPVTPLPVLGGGAVTAAQAQGNDLWVSVAGGFKNPWLGAWMELKDSTGAVLGTWRVLQLDAAGGRALVEAAATGTPNGLTAASFRGLYKLDRIDVRSGAGLSATDEIRTGTMQADGKARLPKTLTADTFTLKSGAQAVVAAGDTLRMSVTGTLTIEAGAILDATGKGYAGTVTVGAGGVPAGVRGASPDAGGSHGGVGALWTAAGPTGEVFDNVYLPGLGGGGGSLVKAYSGNQSGAGGGLIDLTAGTLVLNGEIRSKGEPRPNRDGDTPGAGGSVLVHAGTLSGTGLIDVSGGDYTSYYMGAGSGGGGRVALYVATLSGFDPVLQVKARGGATFNSNNTVNRYAGPGTTFVKLPAQTYGRLIVDQGGVGALAVPNTPLPALGIGTIGTATADTVDPAALWIEPADTTAKFALGVVGMWVRVNSVDYPVLAQSADRRRLLLGGAASAVSTGTAYRGVYKLDEAVVRGGAKLEFRDTNVVGTFTVDSTSSVIQNVP